MHIAITGASSGIGAALAHEFLAAGDTVTLVARRRPEMELIAATAQDRALVIVADLGDLDHCCDWIQQAEARHGPIDVLINNAGIQIVARTTSVAVSQGEDLLRLDLLAPLRITAAVLPGMLARQKGVIVDVASVAALAPTVGMYHYNAAKAALAAASESLRGELRGTGVHVLTVYPGPVDTPMGRAGFLAFPPSKIVHVLPEGTPEGLARRVRAAVLSRKPRVIYPWFYVLTRHLPGITRFVLNRFGPLPLPPSPER